MRPYRRIRIRLRRFAGIVDRSSASWARISRRIAIVAIGLGAFATAHGQMPIETLRGRHCSAQAPHGWAVTGETPTRVGFSAELRAADGSAGASYVILGLPGDFLRDPYWSSAFGTPERAIFTVLSGYGARRLQCNPAHTLPEGLSLARCRDAEYEGVTIYQTFPMGHGGYMLVMRTAATRVGTWQRNGALASATARSIRCDVPIVAPAPDRTPERPKSSGRKRAGNDEGDSEYNRWLDRETYHNPRTGEPFWVSPATDWRSDGPQGAGYYAQRGGELVKLAPGRN
jgi:hypothetical protein